MHFFLLTRSLVVSFNRIAKNLAEFEQHTLAQIAAALGVGPHQQHRPSFQQLVVVQACISAAAHDSRKLRTLMMLTSQVCEAGGALPSIFLLNTL